jgi:hypothetical protein
MNNWPPGVRFSGGKALAICDGCGKLVTINKFLFGSLHICASETELLERHRALRAAQRQFMATPRSNNPMADLLRKP